jgi:copper chaperone
MTKTTTLKVTGMSCGGCTANVEKALKGVNGVKNVTVNLKPGSAAVEFDTDKTNEKDLAAAVKKAGYGVG